ncbi:MAG: glycosyltransferase family 2 protein [Candidatus Limnocylindrus sp.]
MRNPRLSVIVIVYDMPRQALNTLYSLSTAYQEGVSADDYEVIVVENRSPRLMDADAIAALPGNFRYILRDEPGVSPASAINLAARVARSDFICLMIDGARLVTPGIVRYALEARAIDDDALVLAPGYHLGEHEQQFHASRGYSEEKEQELLEGISWKSDGYRLFEISCLSGANPHGWFHPFMECNCLFLSRRVWDDIGRADERFDLPGGGAINLAIYRRAASHPRSRLFVLPGEGSFHQLHGGVTTSEVPEREALLKRIGEQLNELLGEPYRAPTLQPTLLGRVPATAFSFLGYSVERGLRRKQICAKMGELMYAEELSKHPRSTSIPATD